MQWSDFASLDWGMWIFGFAYGCIAGGALVTWRVVVVMRRRERARAHN